MSKEGYYPATEIPLSYSPPKNTKTTDTKEADDILKEMPIENREELEKGFYELMQYDEELVQKIIKALGDDKDFTIEQKDHFIYLLHEDYCNYIANAEITDLLPEHYNKIKESGLKAEAALKAFLMDIMEARTNCAHGNIIEFFALHPAVEIAAKYLENYNAALISSTAFRVGKLVDDVFANTQSDLDKGAALQAIKTVLGANIDKQTSYQDADKFKESIVRAINTLYLSAPDNFLAFMDAIKKTEVSLADNNPLKLYQSPLPAKPKVKTGKHNYKGEEAAHLIASSYYKAFNQLPSRGKGVTIDTKKGIKKSETPYDRVCEVLAERCEINITDHMRKNAIKLLRMSIYRERVGKLCKEMASGNITDEQRGILAEKINSLLPKAPKLRLTAGTLCSAQQSLVKAIDTQFSDAPEKLEDFLCELENFVAHIILATQSPNHR